MHRPAVRTGRRLWSPVLALALLLAPAPAMGAVVAEVRVEGAGKTLAPGHSYVTDTARIRTANAPPSCNGSGSRVRVPGPTALGILDYADIFHSRMRPVRISDEFDFGLFVCGMGDFLGSSTKFWLYKVNHRSPEVGADQFRLARGDRVLWYFQDTEKGINTGDELELLAPARAEPNDEITVRVFAYSSTGVRTPVAGALVSGGSSPAVVVTGADGRAHVNVGDAGIVFLKARRGEDVPSKRRVVCVGDGCPPRRGQRIFGTSRGDRIAGTRGSDVVIARRGNDRINVRRGGFDRVRCGPGFDRVRASRNDAVARDCEVLNGVRRGARRRAPAFTG